MAVDWVGLAVAVKFGDSRLNIIRPNYSTICGPHRFTQFVQYLIAFCSPHEAASDELSGRFVRAIVADKRIQFCDPDHSGEIRPEATDVVFSTVFRDHFRQEITSDVISGAAVQWDGMSVRIKFGDSRSNIS